MSIDDMICELLEEPVAREDNNIVFTSRSIELIHEIAEACNMIPIVNETREQAERYAEGLTAEQVYTDMLYKIVQAPTKIHMLMSARMLVPIIDKKIRGESALPKALMSYSGFLYVRCPVCGEVKGFFSKTRTNKLKCKCGMVTELCDLVPLYMHCECGRNVRYMTNMTEKAFDIDCFNCGAPVAVQWNGKKKLYETIQ